MVWEENQPLKQTEKRHYSMALSISNSVYGCINDFRKISGTILWRKSFYVVESGFKNTFNTIR